MEEVVQKKLRKCYVLREQEVDMETLKHGDVFRIGKADISDTVDDQAWWIAANDGESFPDERNAGIMVQRVHLQVILKDNLFGSKT